MDDLTIGQLVDEARRGDDCDESNELIELYENCTDGGKSLLNSVFISLTGWTLQTIIEMYNERKDE